MHAKQSLLIATAIGSFALQAIDFSYEEYKKTQEHDIAIFFDQERKEKPLAKAISCITSRNIAALKELSANECSFGDSGEVLEAAGSLLINNYQGRLHSKIFIAQNALAFVLLHSATNVSQADNEKTLEMLKVLLEDKKLDPNARITEVLFVTKPAGNLILDYVAEYTLSEIALRYSFPEALELVLQHGAKLYNEKRCPLTKNDYYAALINSIKATQYPAQQEFIQIIERHNK